jgi:eukaryotic-like serine/threonine-protein kinase
VFQLQDELTGRIVSSMSLPLSPADQRRLRRDVPRSPRAYEAFLRANQIAYQSDQWRTARDLYLRCLEDDPTFAPAWAQLGRIYRVLALYRLDDPEIAYEQAQQAFRRALELNPDLGLAHNLYTNLEVELGQAEAAMVRLLDRARHRGADPGLFAGLVQACRYCGLDDASVAAYGEARRLDPSVRTSVHHAYLMRGEYAKALQTNVEDPPIIDLISLELLGEQPRALALARELEARQIPRVYRLFASVARAWLEGKRDECLSLLDELRTTWDPRDPCGRYYLARMLSQAQHPRALETLRQSVEGGFVPYAFLLRDPALDSLRGTAECRTVLELARTRFEQASISFHAADGPRLLGMTDVARS